MFFLLAKDVFLIVGPDEPVEESLQFGGEGVNAGLFCSSAFRSHGMQNRSSVHSKFFLRSMGKYPNKTEYSCYS